MRESIILFMLETILDELDRLTYWPDRNVKAGEYFAARIWRVDFVHVTLDVWPAHDERYRLIIKRANQLLKAGVNLVEANLYDQTSGISGQNMVVGGAIEDNCVLTRAKFLQAQGAGQVIIDLALTADH